MKMKRLAAAATMAGLLCVGSQADVMVSIDAGMTNGYMNVSELPANGGGYLWGSAWGAADLSATFNGTTEVTMVPNSIADTSEYWYVGGGAPGNPGNKSMEANLYTQVDDGTLSGQAVSFAGNVSAFSLTSAHNAVAFIKDFAPDYSSSVVTSVALDATGAFSVDVTTEAGAGRHVQYGIQMTGENVWATDLEPFGSVTVQAIPEPATLGLLGIAGGALLVIRRRFKI